MPQSKVYLPQSLQYEIKNYTKTTRKIVTYNYNVLNNGAMGLFSLVVRGSHLYICVNNDLIVTYIDTVV